VIRKWIFAGLLVWIPLGATLLVLRFVFGLLDSSLLLIPSALRPAVPGLGVLLSIALVLGTGALAANYIGSQLLGWLEGLLQHVPLVRSVYGGMKKLAESVLSKNSSAFKTVVMVEWPRAGMWSVGFQSGDTMQELIDKTGQDLVTVFIPTTPNPTSGFIMSVPRADVQVLDMSVEQGMSYIISLGVVRPEAASAGIQPHSLPAG